MEGKNIVNVLDLPSKAKNAKNTADYTIGFVYYALITQIKEGTFMKNLSVFLAVALFAMLFASCTSTDDIADHLPAPKGSSCWDGEAGQLYTNSLALYKGNGKVYMGDNFEVGTVNNGKIAFNFPQIVDTNFLQRYYSIPSKSNVNPEGAQIWAYTQALRLIDDNGEYVGEIRNIMNIMPVQYNASCWYFSEETEMNGYQENEEDGTRIEFAINSKKGWNKIYISFFEESDNSVMATGLSVPEEFMWVLWEY
jgi:hypothetical protein